MPTTDLDNSAGWAGWLQSLLQNQGAAQPYGPGGAPGPYSGGPNGLMPGGQVLGYHGTTPGQPSMGYPAVGQNAGRPSVAPGMQQPALPAAALMQASAQAAPDYGPGSQRAALNQALNPTGPPQAYPPWPTPPAQAQSAPMNTPQGQMGMPFPQDLGPAGRNMPYPGQTDPRGYYAPPPGPLAAANQPSQATGPMDPSIIARQKMAASPAATATAPPSAASSPFTQVQRPNLPASGYSSGDRMMTALNLARLLGRG